MGNQCCSCKESRGDDAEHKMEGNSLKCIVDIPALIDPDEKPDEKRRIDLHPGVEMVANANVDQGNSRSYFP